MTNRTFRSAAALALAGSVVTGCSTAPAETAAPPLSWSICPEGVEDPEAGPARLQCATVPVLLDYDEPDGRQIDITISKLSSQNPEERRGVLLLNPGGPGGTGLDQPTFLAGRGMPHSVLDTYDLIGMDTRGVGHSSAISCGFTDDVLYYGAVPPYAYDNAAFDEQSATSEEVARRCADNDDGRTSQVSTANMARDLDRIRIALDEEKASFLGYSYGTALGAAYASMFPETSDRVVLDSNIGDTHLDRDGLRRYALGMEQTFPDFTRWTAARNDEYRLGSTEQQVRETYFTIAEKLDRSPAAGINGRTFRLATFVALYNPAGYGGTAELWRSLLDAPDTAAPPLAGENVPSAADNSWSVFLAVTCNDTEWPENPAVYRHAVSEDRERYPLFGAAAANIMPCAYWQSEPSEPPVAIEPDGPTNILVAQHRRDPVTPLRGGELIDEKFGDRSRLLTVDASGHGVYLLGTNQCAADIVTEFLVDGVMPDRDVQCGPESP